MAASLLPLLALGAAHEWRYDGVAHSGVLNATKPTICETTTGVAQHAGTFNIDQGTKSYFYWAFESRTMAADAPTILWMTGGPGCSSSLATLEENGPCHVNKDGSTTLNPFSWNEFANVIFIDQPAGVGFSSGKENDSNEQMVADDMYQFLQAFFKTYPSLNTEFYVFGESYAGHFAPMTASRVFNASQAGEGVKINLVGLGVGNGLTDPLIQYKYYGQLAYNWSIEVQGKPVVSLDTYTQMQEAVPSCIESIKKCNEGAGDYECTRSQDSCNEAILGPFQETGKNLYDITKPCVGQLCYDFSNTIKYMNTKKVQEQLGVSKEWEVCDFGVHSHFGADWMHDFQQTVPPMLAGGIRVLIYAGDLDFICNWIGNKAWAQALPWTGQDAFNAAGDNDWNAGAGKLRTANGFSFLQVHKAGHMVPRDQPKAALQMVKDFVVTKKF